MPSHAVKAVIVDAEGDSTMWGYAGVRNNAYLQSPDNPPAVLQAALQSTYGSGVTVQNNGVPGATAAASLNGVPPAFAAPFAARLAVNPAQIVIGNYAINDSTIVTVAQYQQDLTQWVSAVRAAGKVPVLEEPNPVCASSVPNLGAYRDAMDQIAQQLSVSLVKQYDAILALPNWQSMLIDCIHPDDALYTLKAQREAAVIGPMLSTM